MIIVYSNIYQGSHIYLVVYFQSIPFIVSINLQNYTQKQFLYLKMYRLLFTYFHYQLKQNKTQTNAQYKAKDHQKFTRTVQLLLMYNNCKYISLNYILYSAILHAKDSRKYHSTFPSKLYENMITNNLLKKTIYSQSTYQTLAQMSNYDLACQDSRTYTLQNFHKSTMDTLFTNSRNMILRIKTQEPIYQRNKIYKLQLTKAILQTAN
eukprot:TRINITY_DN374_c0_g1_i6.p1 TRINITY_DN374_c0_g1~~TRINITY_DN374_c0_g1_i6.p1  ORF type:complete len:208 (+),score=-30.17 TRINITY_DN374_c0_g1_i6:326-949(+)